ncbi:hypothetical protein [Streptomyces sp. NPDC017993]|uniref:hypothetical protein n=1 Tax=Streptomyces sp. NPDC017993 TaxID=3365027 RepID=UPI0037A318C0
MPGTRQALLEGAFHERIQTLAEQARVGAAAKDSRTALLAWTHDLLAYAVSARGLAGHPPTADRGNRPGLPLRIPLTHAAHLLQLNIQSRNQGRTLLFHNYLKPVLLRERTPQYVKWEGAIWHRSHTEPHEARGRTAAQELQAGAARVRRGARVRGG